MVIVKTVFITILFLLSRYRFFWRIRTFLRMVNFYFRNFLYRISRYISSKKRQISHLIEIARLGLTDIFLVFLILGAIYLIPYFLFGIDFREPRNVESSYVEILSVVAGVCGVIIGLYYAAILSLGSSTYSKMPSEAKELLRKEPIGSVFVWYLSFLTFFSISLLALYYFKFVDSFFGIKLVLVGSGLAVFGLSKLGYRLFYFTDPTILASSALDLLNESFELATAKKLNSGDSSFQQHYNKQANISLNTYALLANIAKTEDHLKTESYLGLCQSGLYSLARYLRVKNSIPSNSKFFQIKIKHKRWYETGSLNLDLYEKMGHLPPEEIRDHNFVENKILGVVFDCIELNIANKNYEIAEQALLGVTSLAKLFALNYNFQLLIEFCQKIEAISFENAPKDDQSKNSVKYDAYLRIIDGLGYLKSTLLIQFFTSLEEINQQKIEQMIKDIPWDNETKLFDIGFPIFTHEMLLHLNKTVRHEITVQGERISTDWYISNLLFLKYAEGFYRTYKEVFNFTTKQVDFLNRSNLLKRSSTDKWANLYVCCYLDRILEHCQKLHLVNRQFKVVFEMFRTFSKIDGFTWPDYKSDNYDSELSKFETSLTAAISKSGAVFNIYQFPSAYPDYGGKFLHFVGNKILQHLIDTQSFDKNTYAMFHVGSLVMFDKLRTDLSQVDNMPVNNQLHFMVAPIIDLVTLSGLIILFARFLKEDEYENIVRECWDNYLKDDSEQKLKKLSAILQYPESTFVSLPHRHAQRFNWHRDAFQYLTDKLEVKEEWYVPGGGARAYQQRHIVNHESALVCYLVAQRSGHLGGMKDEGLDVFIDFYLISKMKALGIQEMKFTRDQGDLAERVSREETRLKNKDGQEDED